MTVPLVILGILSVVGGWIGIPHVISAILPGHPPHVLEHWLEPILKSVSLPSHDSVMLEWGLMGLSVFLAMLGAFLAYYVYLRRPGLSETIAKKFGFLYELVYKKYKVDEIYFSKIINPLVEVSQGLWFYIDVKLIDQVTYLISSFIKRCGESLSALQNGNLQQYAMYIVLGLVAIMTIVLMR